jgi:neutral ceramidase
MNASIMLLAVNAYTLGASVVAAPPGTQPAPFLRVGFAECDITPAIGMEQPGGYGKAFHRTIHDPCKVRAVVFDDGRSRVALVGVDALMVPRHLIDAVRAEIQKRCGIAPGAVMIGASHSHSSGPTGMVQPGEFDDASPLVRSLAYERSSCADAGYLARLQKEIVAAVDEANAHRVEARCAVGTGNEDKVAFNRRFRMKNGLTFTHPGKGNPDIVGAAGPTDPQVGVIGVWDAKGNLLGCVVNYACHATTNPGGISANWIHYLDTTIRGAMGPKAVVVFLQGFSGDVTQVDNLSKYDERPAEEGARFVGARVGAEAVKVLGTAEKGAIVPLDARSRVLRLPRRAPAPERVRRCLERVQKDPAAVGQTEWTFAKETVLLDAILAKAPTVEAEVQAIQVGPAVFVAAPGEMFCQLGLDLKAGSPFPFTFPVELANGCVGYVPTEDAFGEHGGGYETRLTSYSNLQPDAGTRMVDAALTLVRKMKIGVIPARRPAPPFKAPWSYGDVPPELK